MNFEWMNHPLYWAIVIWWAVGSFLSYGLYMGLRMVIHAPSKGINVIDLGNAYFYGSFSWLYAITHTLMVLRAQIPLTACWISRRIYPLDPKHVKAYIQKYGEIK